MSEPTVAPAAPSSGEARGPGVPAALSREDQRAALLVWLVVVDAVVLTGNVLHSLAPGSGLLTDREAWNGNTDGSYAEMLGHAQLLLAVAILAVLWRRRGGAIYGAWALLLAVVVADDFLRIHETAGSWAAVTFGLPGPGGLRAQDVGELGVWAALGLVLGSVVVVAHLRSPDHRDVTWTLARLLLVLAAFAVVVDMMGSAVARFLEFSALRMTTFLETTGELGAMSLILLGVHQMMLRPTAPPGSTNQV
ncbi:hypothetical protein ENKNEFLB_00791 [Nocardioides aquaticus]|uniref:DUF4386 family protein n=1 Tax=Nocardioides aquaticus TaxID=160826 RepID=A0ABX8EDB8_9ACTN|nr:hypothetical protein [Nocardioides aquaticus]QVT78414.1 hypothetical protein ENKNEFLB_00791 [Nocardioides aquaticus]